MWDGVGLSWGLGLVLGKRLARENRTTPQEVLQLPQLVDLRFSFRLDFGLGFGIGLASGEAHIANGFHPGHVASLMKLGPKHHMLNVQHSTHTNIVTGTSMKT